jgi:hypothetical protein
VISGKEEWRFLSDERPQFFRQKNFNALGEKQLQ